MSNGTIVLKKRDVREMSAVELKQKKLGNIGADSVISAKRNCPVLARAVRPLVVYRIIREGQEVDSWISGKVAFNIIRPT